MGVYVCDPQKASCFVPCCSVRVVFAVVVLLHVCVSSWWQPLLHSCCISLLPDHVEIVEKKNVRALGQLVCMLCVSVSHSCRWGIIYTPGLCDYAFMLHVVHVVSVPAVVSSCRLVHLQ